MSRKVLGKSLSDLGLDVLLSHNNLINEDFPLQHIPINLIHPDPSQPRRNFNEEGLESLRQSIVVHGVLQPILVTKIDNGYQLIAGERRYRAAILAGLTTLPVLCKSLSEQDRKYVALVENIQREDLSPIETASSMFRLINEHNLTHQVLSEALGTSRSQITNLLRLLTLSPMVVDAIENKKIDVGHARCLVGLDEEKQANLLDKIIKKNLNVRQVELLVKEKKNNKPADKNILIPSLRIKKNGNWFNLSLKTDNAELISSIKKLVNDFGDD